MNAQLQQLMIAYGVTAGAMLSGMWLMRADRRGYFRWPLYSAMAMFLAVWSWNALRNHAVPAEWQVTHSALLYYGALGLYAAFGFAIGLLAGRATRTRNIFEKEIERPGDEEQG